MHEQQTRSNANVTKLKQFFVPAPLKKKVWPLSSGVMASNSIPAHRSGKAESPSGCEIKITDTHNILLHNNKTVGKINPKDPQYETHRLLLNPPCGWQKKTKTEFLDLLTIRALNCESMSNTGRLYRDYALFERFNRFKLWTLSSSQQSCKMSG